MRFDTADADSDASPHADPGDNPHSHANAYPNPSPNRYSHADSDANPHSNTHAHSNTRTDSHANAGSHTNAHSRANTGTDVSTNASANTRTYDCHNSRPGDRCNSQSHRHNARYRGGHRLFASAAGPWASSANVTVPLPHAHGCAHERSARDDICSGNQPGAPALHARGDTCPGSWPDALAFPPALHARGNTCPGSWPDALAYPASITSAPSPGRSIRDAIEPRWSTFPPPVPEPPFRPTVLMSRRGT